MITTIDRGELNRQRRANQADFTGDIPPSSVIIWRGYSPADGAPLVAIVTNLRRPSENRKTGDMAQVYILRSDVRPADMVRDGLDVSTCGNCPLRPTVADGGPSCYVNVGWLGRLWDSIPSLSNWNAGIVGDYCAAVNLPIRDGAYGDPAMLPGSVWDSLHKASKRGTSYTHQWQEDWTPRAMAQFAMASVQTVSEKRRANAMGYRTYRVTDGDLEPDEILCPESTRGVACADCGLCAGNRVDAKNIVIRPL